VTDVRNKPSATPPDSTSNAPSPPANGPADAPAGTTDTTETTSPPPQAETSTQPQVSSASDDADTVALGPVAPDVEDVGVLGRAALVARHHWPVFVVLALFATAATVVPTMTNIATTDDWGYTRSVELLYWDVELRIFPVVAATAVGQVLWGGLFALIFGMELGVMRLSTVVMIALGGVAFYSLLRQLGVTRSRSTLGMAIYLFNPLTFVLAFTFMTDPHFTSVLLMTVALYVRGLDPAQRRPRVIVLASLFAGFAFLFRQQGALIPLSVGLYLLLARRLRFDWASVRLVLQVTALPALTLVGYYAWLRFINDVPDVQASFLRDAVERAGVEGTWRLGRSLLYMALVYVGFACAPLILTLAPSPWRWRLPWRKQVALPEPSRPSGFFTSPVGWWLWLGWLGVLITGLFFFTARGRRMPYISQFLGSSGFGPPDVRGSRLKLIEPQWDWFYSALTIICVVAAIAVGAILFRKIGSMVTPERAGAGLVAMVLFWQLLGVLPPSYQYIRSSGSLDRYMLPLFPLTIALAFWALREVRLFQPIGWAAMLLLGTIATAGTRDYLMYMDAVWDMAHRANAAGIPNTKLDAGSGWDGYHLYTQMLDENITRALSPPGAPWWVYFYAKPTDSTYVVATNPAAVPGYYVVAAKPYDQWLEDDPVYVFLMARVGAPRPVIDVMD